MEKRLRICSLVCLLVLLVSACGPSEEEIQSLIAEPQDEPVVIRWLVTGEGTEPWIQSMENDFVRAFNSSQSRITLEMETGGGGGGGYGGFGNLSERLQNGDIDIVGPMAPSTVGRFTDVWVDIESLAMESASLGGFDASSMEAWRREGKLVGVPFGFWPAVLYYNKDIFDKAGLPYPPHKYGEEYAQGGAWSLDKVAEIAPLMTLDRNGNSAQMAAFDPDLAKQWGFMMEGNDLRAAVAIFGSTSINASGGTVVLPQAWRDAAHWIHNALWVGKFFPSMRALESLRGDPFGQGQAAMFYVPSSYYCCVTPFNYDMAAVPSFNGKVTSRRDHVGFSIPISSQHQEEAMQVIMKIINDPSLIRSYRIVPAQTALRSDLLGLLREQNSNIDWQVMVDSIDYPDDPPYSQFLPQSNTVLERFGNFAEALLTNENLDVDSELDKLEADLQEIMAP